MFRETLEKQAFAIWQQKMSQHRENRLAERMVCSSLFVWVLAGRIHLSTCPRLLFRKLHKLQPTLPGSCLVLLGLGGSGHSQAAWGSSSLLVTDSPLASDLLSSYPASGCTAGRAAAFAEVLVPVAAAGSSMSPRAGAADHGLCSPPQQAAQEGFLRLEGKCPRIENRVSPILLQSPSHLGPALAAASSAHP